VEFADTHTEYQRMTSAGAFISEASCPEPMSALLRRRNDEEWNVSPAMTSTKSGKKIDALNVSVSKVFSMVGGGLDEDMDCPASPKRIGKSRSSRATSFSSSEHNLAQLAAGSGGTA